VLIESRDRRNANRLARREAALAAAAATAATSPIGPVAAGPDAHGDPDDQLTFF